MWLILQQDKPDDFVVATGETHSVREFCEEAFKVAGITLQWKGERGSVDEVGIDAATGNVIVRIDPKYFRPTEVDFLLGDPKKAQKILNWKRRISFKELVREMVLEDIKLVEQNKRVHDE